MTKFLAVVASVSIVVLLNLSILPPVQQIHPAGHGGVHGVLVPAGDDSGGH